MTRSAYDLPACYGAWCATCQSVTPHRDGQCQNPAHAVGFPRPAFDQALRRDDKAR